MSKITEGPWLALKGGTDPYRWVVSSPNGVICECEGKDREANARAIASLPDLIKAAKELSDANEALTNAIDKMVEWEEPIAEQARLALAWRALRFALAKGGANE